MSSAGRLRVCDDARSTGLGGAEVRGTTTRQRFLPLWMPAPLTWTTLLAHWTGVAQRALALPRTPDADRLRGAVPHLIGLQAIAHALGHADSLPADERALGLDRAELGFRDHSGAIHVLYDDSPDPMPEPLVHAIADARAALSAARGAGLGWVVTAEALTTEHPAELVAALLGGGFDGDLILPTPGATLFRGCPCAFVRAPADAPIEDLLLALIGMFLGQKQRLAHGPVRARAPQVYRQFDFAKGGPTRDLVVPWSTADVPGQPLLLSVLVAGEPQPVPLPPRHRAPVGQLPVVFADT